MIGFAQESILSAIQAVWVGTLAVSKPQWRRMFHLNIPEGRVDRLHTALTSPENSSVDPARYVAFGLTELLSRGNDSPPGVFVRLSSARPSITADGSVEGQGYAHMMNSIEVFVIADRQDVAGALTTAVMNCVWTRRAQIMRDTGISNLSYPSVEECSPQRDMLPERGGAFWFRLRYDVGVNMNLIQIAEESPAAVGISIHDERATDSHGNVGRVKPRLTTT